MGVISPARRLRVLLAGLGLAVVVVVGFAGPASAHATLDSTTPEQGSRLSAPPTSVSLRFSEAVSLGSRAVQVVDAAGRRVDDGAPHHPAGDGHVVEVGVRGALPHGTYTVVWRVVSADSHPIAGTFSFGVGVAAGSASASATDDASVDAVDAVLRGAAYVGAVLLLGAAFFLVVLWPSGFGLRRCRRLLGTGWSLSVAAAAGLFLLQGPYGSGVGLTSVLDPELVGDTLTSRYGKLMLLRLLVLVLAVPALRRAAVAVPSGSGLDLAALGAVFVLSFSLAEHAGQGSWVVLSVPADAVHLASACVWIGGLAVLATCLLVPGVAVDGSARSVLEHEGPKVLPAWSRVAMAAVALLVVTGAFQAWRGIGSLGALTGTTYGVLVLGKVAGLALLLVLGDQGRRWIGRRALETRPASTPVPVGGRAQPAAHPEGTGLAPAPTRSTAAELPRIRRTVVAELGVAVVVLGFTTALVTTVPGEQAYAPPYAATVTARSADGGAVTLLLDVDSTRAGPTTLHLYSYTSAGAVLPFATADGRLTNTGSGLGPVRFAFAPTGPGHGTAEGVVVPGPGAWTLTVQLHTDATTDYAATTSFQVH